MSLHPFAEEKNVKSLHMWFEKVKILFSSDVNKEIVKGTINMSFTKKVMICGTNKQFLAKSYTIKANKSPNSSLPGTFNSCRDSDIFLIAII